MHATKTILHTKINTKKKKRRRKKKLAGALSLLLSVMNTGDFPQAEGKSVKDKIRRMA